MKRIGIISDTHGLLREEVKDILKTCEVILHAGDIHKESVLEELKTIAPVYAVRGNNDREWVKSITIKIEIFGINVFMIHNRKQIQEIPSDCQVVIYGHSHKYSETKEDGRVWLNPGSCGPRRFWGAVTMAVMEVQDDGNFIIKKIELLKEETPPEQIPEKEIDREQLVKSVIKDMNRGRDAETIAARNGITTEMAEHIYRLYVTHPGIDAEGIMNRMDLKRM